MIHRGPDDAGCFLSDDRKVGLGHRRLSIIDLAGGHQPMSNEDGTVWIVFNGEIYNHAALRRDLEARGHRYRTRCDTETILHLYEEEGPDCVHRLEGMFAFVIWDSRRQTLFGARDRIGIKPFYYHQDGGRFLFASEIKSILKHPGVSREIDREGLYHYLTFVVTPPPLTLFKGIRKLPPGHRLLLDRDGNLKIERYWNLPLEDDAPPLSEEDYADEVVRLLRQSIADRMMSDVPFGVFLSGGIDSTTNVALMSRLMDRPVDTFYVGFRDLPHFDESGYARKAAEHFGANHREIVIDAKELISLLPKLIYHQDEPIADPVCVPLFYVSKLARDNGVIVVQVGEGSDEQFSGYDTYMMFQDLYRRRWKPFAGVPSFVKRAGWTLLDPFLRNRWGVVKRDYLRRLACSEELFWGGAIAFWELEKRSLLSRGFLDGERPESSFGIVNPYLREMDESMGRLDFLKRLIYLEFKLRLPELLLMRVDKITMANSVESRVPFLDHRLVELTARISSGLKVTDNRPKHILKKAVRGLIPDEIIDRKKQGFGAPIKEWFSGSLKEYAREKIFESGITKEGIFDYGYVKHIFELNERGESDYGFQLWNLFNLSSWYDYWIEGREI